MNTKRILLLNEDVEIAQDIKQGLESLGGYEVFIEKHAVNALGAADYLIPDLILMDLTMPGIKRREFIDGIIKNEVLGDTPVLFLTASVAIPDAETNGVSTGGEKFVAKAFDLGGVKKVIDEKIMGAAVKPRFCEEMPIEEDTYFEDEELPKSINSKTSYWDKSHVKASAAIPSNEMITPFFVT